MTVHPLSRRRLAIAALCLVAASAAFAQNKTTRLIVAFPPGGPVDFVARAVGEQLGKELGHTVIIDNKPGGNGTVAASDVIRSPADGTTLWITSVGAVAVNPALYEKLGYDVNRDLTPVSLVANNVELLVVNKSDPAGNASDFVANSKKAKQPVAMASSGIGSIPHLAILQLQDASGANLLHVPYKGAAPAINDVIGGQVGAFFGDIPGLIGFVRSGTLKAIGIASTKRHPALPDVKTLAEQGIPNVDTNNWYAVFASAKTSPAVIDSVNKALKRALDDKTLRDKLLNTGAEPASSTPTELAALLKQDGDKWAKLIKAKNIKPE